MLSTDDIFLLATALSADGCFAGALSEQLRALHASPSYQGWLGTLAEAEPFVLPDWVDGPLLNEARLTQSGRLLVKLNRPDSGIFLTDGVWVEPRLRVFPFCDESTALVDFVCKAGLARSANWTLDLATGCGINAMSIGGRSLACDINPRALAYAAVNRTLNGIPGDECVLALNDIRHGIPKILGVGLEGQHVLILANMPFGPAPSPEALPLTSNGGTTGADLQIASYRAVADLVRSARSRFSFTACLMGLTVGDRTTDRWDIVDHAIRQFGADRIRWHLLAEEHVIRIDGVRQFGNPAPVAVALPGLASCRLYTPDERERTARIAAFTELAERHEADGNPDIAYGIVEIIGNH
jgi:hypothetical protein